MSTNEIAGIVLNISFIIAIFYFFIAVIKVIKKRAIRGDDIIGIVIMSIPWLNILLVLMAAIVIIGSRIEDKEWRF